MKHSPQYHGVYSDLLAYTGLSPADLEKRLERREHFHFEGEHAWWDPKSVGELTWFYRSSVSYLFANADHPQESEIIAQLESEDGPVLDYSGGVGSTVLGLAAKNISCHYFGIGVQEVAFAEFRVARRSVQHLVKIVSPYAFIEGEYRFHAYNVSLADITHMHNLANPRFNTMLVDDTQCAAHYCVDAALEEHQRRGTLRTLLSTSVAPHDGSRGISVGTYLH